MMKKRIAKKIVFGQSRHKNKYSEKQQNNAVDHVLKRWRKTTKLIRHIRYPQTIWNTEDPLAAEIEGKMTDIKIKDKVIFIDVDI